MRDTTARADLGLSKFRLAELLGCDRKTLTIYEHAPSRVGLLRRAAFAVAYGALRMAVDGIALARLALRKGG